jgi:hypothetical protein
MKLFSRRIAVLVGLGLLSAGCVAESIADGTEATPCLSPQDGPTGASGTNGLKPRDYHPRRMPLEVLLKMPLTVNGALNPDSKFSDFISTPEGISVFSHAVGCALPTSISVAGFQGEGLMASTGSWLTGPLDLQQQSDINTCLAARLNPYGVVVPIWIGGPDTVQAVDASQHPYFEAVWSVNVNSDGLANYWVWAADTFPKNTPCKDQLSIQRDFSTRICENNSTICQITLRTDMATACQGQPGGGKWTCFGKPALETRLSMKDWNLIHPKCMINLP